MPAVYTGTSLKMTREALCLAQTRLGGCRCGIEVAAEQDRRASEVLQRLINSVDLQRPLGPDGKHGERHTATCGCPDVPLKLRVARWLRWRKAVPNA